MKYKVVILVLLLTLTCGCSVTYDLQIDGENNYIERTEINSEGNEQYEKEYLYNLYLEEYPIYYSEDFLYYSPNERKEGNTYYNKSIYETNNGYNATYNAEFDNDSFKDSRMLKTAFKDISIGYNLGGDYYYLDLNNLKIFNNKSITNIKVNIHISNDYVVIYNNANSNVNNTYTWNFSDESARLIIRYQEKEIYNQKEKNKDNEEQKSIEKEDDNSIIYVIISLIGFLIILFIILKLKSKNKF